MVIIPVIIIANVIAGIVYHFTSAETRARRTQRQLEAKARDEEQRQNDEELQLHYAQQSLLRRQAELPRKIALANLKIAQDQLERDAMQALFGNGDVERAMGGNIGIQPQETTNLADIQAQLKALQSLGVQMPATANANAGTSTPVNDEAENHLGGKLNPANWNLFGNNGADPSGSTPPADSVKKDKAPPPHYHPTAEELAQDEGENLPVEKENDVEDGGANSINPTPAFSA